MHYLVKMTNKRGTKILLMVVNKEELGIVVPHLDKRPDIDYVIDEKGIRQRVRKRSQKISRIIRAWGAGHKVRSCTYAEFMNS